MQTLDDVLGAIAPVLVEVEDADLACLSFGEQDRRRDHQSVEGAVPAGKVVAGMMEAGAGGNRADPVIQCFARRREHRAAGPGQGGGHGRRLVAETVGPPAAEHVGHEIRVMGDTELLRAERLRGAEFERQAEELPGFDGQGRLAGAGREAFAVGDHRRAVEDGDGHFAGRILRGTLPALLRGTGVRVVRVVHAVFSFRVCQARMRYRCLAG